MSTVALAIGAVLHGLAFAVFCVLMFVADTQRRRHIANAGSIVALITAGLNAALALTTLDPYLSYLLTWIGYSVCLFAIGKSLATFTFAPNRDGGDVVTPAFLLALVGLGGVVALAVPSSFQIAAVVTTSVLYLLFFFMLWVNQERHLRAITWLLVIFFLATVAFYIIPFIVGYPVLGRSVATASTIATEQWLYLVGNVITKIAVPLYEYAVIESLDAMSNARPLTTTQVSSSSKDRRYHFV